MIAAALGAVDKYARIAGKPVKPLDPCASLSFRAEKRCRPVAEFQNKVFGKPGLHFGKERRQIAFEHGKGKTCRRAA